MMRRVPNQGLLAYALKESFVEAGGRKRWSIRSEDANLCSWGDLASARLALEERASLAKVNIHSGKNTPLQLTKAGHAAREGEMVQMT